MKKFIAGLFVFGLGLFISSDVLAVTTPADTSVVIVSPLHGTTHDTNFVELIFSQENATNCWYDLGGLRLSDGVKGDENDPAFQYPLPGCLVTTLDLPNGEYTLNLHSSNEGDSQGLDSSWFIVDKAPEPSQCYVVSDTTNIVENGGYAVQAYDLNSSWIEENVLGRLSKWIWDTEQVLNPTSDEIKVFEKKFNISGEIDSAILKVAVDNSYELEINGQTVTVPGMDGEDNFSSLDEVDVKTYLIQGENIIKFRVKNWAQAGGTYDSNPAGLLYNLELKVYGECSLIDSEPQCGEGQIFDEETNSCINEEYPEPEINACNNGLDDDGDGFTDMQDPGCTNSEDNNEEETPILECSRNQTLRDGRCITRQSSGSRLGGYISQNNTEDGRVLGATTTCGIYVDKYLRKGYQNDVEAVKKVQKFLNEYISAGLIEDGFYGEKTEAAVKSFQIKNADNILTPWNIQDPTGIFYLTTQTEVNNIMCPELKLEKPQSLIPFRQNPLSPKKA